MDKYRIVMEMEDNSQYTFYYIGKKKNLMDYKDKSVEMDKLYELFYRVMEKNNEVVVDENLPSHLYSIEKVSYVDGDETWFASAKEMGWN